MLYVGSWPQWYDQGAPLYFNFPSDPMFQHQFFLSPNPEELRWLDWARVRIACHEPNIQISPWHDVDLSRANWD